MTSSSSSAGTAIVTGSTGIFGRFISEGLVKAGYETICVCRDKIKGEELVQNLKRSFPNANVRYALVDCSSKTSIQNFANQLAAQQSTTTRIDILVNNAAVTPTTRKESEAGIEMQFATNVLGYHWFIKSLEKLLANANGTARVTNVASFYTGGLDLSDPEFKKRAYDADSAYRASKQANRMNAKSWADKLKDKGITVTSCHPGVATSSVSLGLGFDIDRSVDAQRQGAVTPLHCVLNPKEKLVSGAYYSDCKMEKCSYCAHDDECGKLWDLLESY